MWYTLRPPIYSRLLFWAHGFCLTPNIIIIRPDRKWDTALLAHERHHARQMRGLGVLKFWVAYLFPSFRARVESSAYKVQVKLRPDLLDSYANALATKYFLGISEKEARAMLSA